MGAGPRCLRHPQEGGGASDWGGVRGAQPRGGGGAVKGSARLGETGGRRAAARAGPGFRLRCRSAFGHRGRIDFGFRSLY